MRSTARDRFIHDGIPQQARECKKFLEVTLPLVSVGKLCVNGMIVVFDDKQVHVLNKNGALVSQGTRDPNRNLYLMPIASRSAQSQRVEAAQLVQEQRVAHTANSAYEARTVPALMSYLHGCAGFLPKTTWIKGIKANFYPGWPLLTPERVEKYLPKSEATVMGHMKMIRMGIRSSRVKLRSREHDVGIQVISTAELKNTVATDLPGRFPVTSATGSKYIFIMYDCDGNYIKPLAMKSRETDEMIRCYEECYEHYNKSGFKARLIKMDNEVSKRMIRRIEDDKLEYQLVSPGDHRLNPCERAIQDFKNHFISMLYGADDDFPKNRWDLLLDQAEITLNMRRTSNVNPKVSAYTLINGIYNFNKNPLSPAGFKTIVHDRSDERAS